MKRIFLSLVLALSLFSTITLPTFAASNPLDTVTAKEYVEAVTEAYAKYGMRFEAKDAYNPNEPVSKYDLEKDVARAHQDGEAYLIFSQYDQLFQQLPPMRQKMHLLLLQAQMISSACIKPFPKLKQLYILYRLLLLQS